MTRYRVGPHRHFVPPEPKPGERRYRVAAYRRASKSGPLRFVVNATDLLAAVPIAERLARERLRLRRWCLGRLVVTSV